MHNSMISLHMSKVTLFREVTKSACHALAKKEQLAQFMLGEFFIPS